MLKKKIDLSQEASGYRFSQRLRDWPYIQINYLKFQGHILTFYLPNVYSNIIFPAVVMYSM